MTDHCIHIANLFYLAGFLGWGMLWLRTFNIVGLAFGIAFFCSRTEPLFGPVGWHVVFIGINLAMMLRQLLIQRRVKSAVRSPEAIDELLAEFDEAELRAILAKSLRRENGLAEAAEPAGRASERHGGSLERPAAPEVVVPAAVLEEALAQKGAYTPWRDWRKRFDGSGRRSGDPA